MKKFLIMLVIGVFSVMAISFFLVNKKQNEKQAANSNYLRVHIRANSNSTNDQNVKYKVKEKVVEFLSPLLANCTSQKQAKDIAAKNIKKINEIANKTLKENDFNYCCNAQIRTENFPTRSYGNITLESGEYDALILELGSGKGDNWWCVMFPPLCFIGPENNNSNKITYKSKIWEFFKKFF